MPPALLCSGMLKCLWGQVVPSAPVKLRARRRRNPCAESLSHGSRALSARLPVTWEERPVYLFCHAKGQSIVFLSADLTGTHIAVALYKAELCRAAKHTDIA